MITIVPQKASFDELEKRKWKKKMGNYNDVIFEGLPDLEPFEFDFSFQISLSGKIFNFSDSNWTLRGSTQEEEQPVQHDAILEEENVALRRRIEDLTHTAAVSQIQIQLLENDIAEADELIANL